MNQTPRLFLHQYDSSPFSEKVRVALGIKGLTWYAVDQPVIMPKPELTHLTGGYRRIPVLQIGADIYCDSQLILRELERRFPQPSLLVGDDRALSFGMGLWTDRSFFQSAVTVIFGGNEGIVDDAFKKDREALTGRPFDSAAMAQAAPLLAEQLRAHAAILADQLADGRDFLMGSSPGLVDANAYYNLWFVRSFYPDGVPIFDDLPGLHDWQERVRAIGHGDRHKASRQDAIDAARDAEPEPGSGPDPGEPNALTNGMTVTVMADDYGRDKIEGQLVSSTPHEIALRRQVDFETPSGRQPGEVVVHFPRAGFLVVPQKP
jgi:glutathione S-transferase